MTVLEEDTMATLQEIESGILDSDIIFRNFEDEYTVKCLDCNSTCTMTCSGDCNAHCDDTCYNCCDLTE